MNTTFNRHVQTPGYPYGTQKGWVTVQPKGSKIVGMFATCVCIVLITYAEISVLVFMERLTFITTGPCSKQYRFNIERFGKRQWRENT